LVSGKDLWELGVCKDFHIMEPKLDYFDERREGKEFNSFIFSDLRMFQFGLLHAPYRLELCFVRAQNSKRGVVLRLVIDGPRVTPMMSKKLVLTLAFVLCMTILGGTAWADNIPIVNPSFESAGPLNTPCGTGCAYNYGPVPGIPGWSSVGGGSWMPGSFFTSIPDGSLIAFANAQSSLTQTLTGNSVLTNSLYTFSVFVGDRTDGINGNYILSLDTIVGGVTTTLCSVPGNAASIARGTFQLESCTYASGSSVPSGNLFLQLSAVSGQLDVDNVSLTVQPVTTSVPEPSSVLLLSIGMLLVFSTLLMRRKKDLQITA